jgi:hypothetical protein
MKLGERITVQDFMDDKSSNVDLMDGVTLCGYCQYYFKSDGEQDICNNCIKRNKGE